MAWSKVKSSLLQDIAHIQPPTTVYQVSTSYTLQFPRYILDKILEGKVTMARSNVKSRSQHDVADLHPLTNIPTKYPLPTPYSFRDTAQTNTHPPLPTRPPIWTPWVKTIRAVG